MKKELCYQILNKLLQSENYTPVSVISEEFDVSSKTIRNYLINKEFLTLIYPCKVDKKPNLGVKLTGSKEQINRLKRSIFVENTQNKKEIFKNNDQSKILNLLFNSKNKITYNQLKEELYQSKNSIKDQIIDIKNFLKEYNIELKDNIGISIDGDEKNIRKAYKKFTSNFIAEKIGKNNQEIIKLNSEFIKIIEGLFPKIKTKNLLDIISNSEKMLGYKITNIDKVQLLIRLSILIERLLIEKTITFKYEELRNTKEYFTAEIIRIHIEKEYPITISESEVLEIAKYILACRSQKKYIQEEELDLKVVKKFLKKISDFTEVDFSNDKILQTNLITHLKPAIRRLKFGVKSENPILKEIRYEYSDIYLAVLTSIEEIEEIEDVAFNINEIGYICLHIISAINRKEKGRYITTCLICDSGLAVTNYLESIITNELQELLLVKSITSGECNTKVLEEYDLILDSTATINNKHKNVIQINLMFNSYDNIQINHWIINKQINKKKNKKGFKNSVFLFEEEKINQYDLLKKYGAYLVENKFVNTKFIESIFDREEKASTLIGKGVAVPHGNYKYVKKSAIIIIELKEKIQWGDETVDRVFLLAMNFENEKENKMIFRRLYQIIADDEKLEMLKNAKDLKTISEMFFY